MLQSARVTDFRVSEVLRVGRGMGGGTGVTLQNKVNKCMTNMEGDEKFKKNVIKNYVCFSFDDVKLKLGISILILFYQTKNYNEIFWFMKFHTKL